MFIVESGFKWTDSYTQVANRVPKEVPQGSLSRASVFFFWKTDGG